MLTQASISMEVEFPSGAGFNTYHYLLPTFLSKDAVEQDFLTAFELTLGEREIVLL